ncbi:MAG TPA: sigma-70 family RNA polymerase sigma factor [Candidatus Limnocylindria bacterium]|jgi:RNA polymerase sigma factor (sigma-70 family)|nr:sigma-70 family RNA polymerase sigma factor [Candidatus Limnocylindria bacterium]
MRRSHAAARHSVSPDVSLPPFQVLVDTHATELHRFLAASIGPDLAEDCLQDTFISALRAYPRLRHGENLRAWLYTIAHRKATDVVRRHARRPASVDLDGMPPGREPSVAPHEPPDDGLWRRVRALPGKQRAAVVHRFVMDLDYRAIGELMGTSEEAARQNVSAGLKRLRQELDR